jgi:hypothetical protein
VVVAATHRFGRCSLGQVGHLPACARSGGLLLANACLAALFCLFADWGWLPINDVAATSWIGLVSVVTILAVGMSWLRLRGSRPPGTA